MLPKIKTILYCTSLGPHAPYVFAYACSLAKGLGAQLVILHVMETLNRKQKTLLDSYAGSGGLQELIDQAHREAAAQLPGQIEATLSGVCGADDWQRLVQEVVVAEGRSEKRIHETIEAMSADIVVIGAHTRSSIVDRMIGSTARSLIKFSPVPVLTVQVPNVETNQHGA